MNKLKTFKIITPSLMALMLMTSACLNSIGGGKSYESKPTKLQNLVDLQVAPPPPKVNFELKYYCNNTNWNMYEDFIAHNYSSKIQRMSLHPDSDDDGLHDQEEQGTSTTLALSPSNPNTAALGISDLLVFRAGILVPDQTRLRCPSSEMLDNDQDGLLDCEEKRLTHTKPDMYDDDGDSIPDGLELIAGLNARDPNDGILDPDNDGVSNFDEVKLNTPVDENNKQPAITQLKYNYRIERQQVNASGQICTIFKVYDVPMLSSRKDHLMRFFFYERTNSSTNRSKRQLSFKLVIDINQWAGLTVKCDVQGPVGTSVDLTAPQTPDCPYQ